MPDTLPPPDHDDPAPAIPPAASATEALYRAALGPGRSAGYLPVFARFDELGMTRPQWNHAAGWLGWHWLLYRRLWREALAVVALLLAALAGWWWAHEALGPWPAGVRWGLLAAIVTVAVVGPGWWGNGWLHADVRRRMTAAVRRARTVQEACEWLAQPSPTRWVWLGVLALELGLVAWWWSLPAARSLSVAPVAPEPVVAERLADAPRGEPPARSEASVMVTGAVSEPPTAAPPAPPPTSSPTGPASEPAPPDPSAPLAAPAGSSPAPTTDAPAAAPTAAAASPAPAPEPAASAVGQPVDAPLQPRPRLEGHGVAVGMFADPANAERAARRLRDAGLPVVSDPVESARGTLTRVRVGPFATREQAQAAAETVRRLGLEARVFGPR